MILACPMATSGRISGSGLAMAKTMGSSFMLSRCSTVSTSGTAGTPLAVGVLGEPLLRLVQPLASLVHDAPRVAADDVPDPGGEQNLGAGYPRSPDSVHDDPQVFHL